MADAQRLPTIRRRDKAVVQTTDVRSQTSATTPPHKSSPPRRRVDIPPKDFLDVVVLSTRGSSLGGTTKLLPGRPNNSQIKENPGDQKFTGQKERIERWPRCQEGTSKQPPSKFLYDSVDVNDPTGGGPFDSAYEDNEIGSSLDVLSDWPYWGSDV